MAEQFRSLYTCVQKKRSLFDSMSFVNFCGEDSTTLSHNIAMTLDLNHINSTY